MRVYPFLLAAALLPVGTAAQEARVQRLPEEVLDVVPPSTWAQGTPGRMEIRPAACRAVPEVELRRRIVDIAVQEWVFFGTPVLDRIEGARLLPPGITPPGHPPAFERTTRRPRTLNDAESARVAATIAGYWAVTPEGPGIVREQNETWRQRGIGSRWRAHWSAAFVSWVMCEAGLDTEERFVHAIAHWRYIDQAIRARDGNEPAAAYVAREIGERPVAPGDLLCSGRRPRYTALAERRRQMGSGASTHCDIVVSVDEAHRRILGIGGNVLRSVSLKVLPGAPAPEGGLLSVSTPSAPLFVHLELQSHPMGDDGLAQSQVVRQVKCPGGPPVDARLELVLSRFAPGEPAPLRCPT